MKYEVRVQNRHTPDVVISDVEESDVGNVVTTWCTARSVCIVTPKESEVSKSTHASLCNCVELYRTKGEEDGSK